MIFTSSGVGITGFPGLSAYASTKGALEALAKCLNLEYAGDGVTFHLIHPPLTRTQSSAPLPVPPEMMADPETVGQGLARRLFSPRFLLCHSLLQKVQTLLCYAFPPPHGQPPGQTDGAVPRASAYSITSRRFQPRQEDP